MDSHESLVDLIFTKCSLVYGRDFLSRWEGLDLAEVKADWVRELGGLLRSPAAIVYGLERLPVDRPPTVLQFRALCIGAPGDVRRGVDLALPAPPVEKMGKERIDAILAETRAKLTRAA